MKRIDGTKVYVYRPDTCRHCSLSGKAVIIKKGLFCSLVRVYTGYWQTHRVSNKWIFANGVKEN